MPPADIRSFCHRDFDAADLVAAKGHHRISVCVPARDEEATIGDVVTTIHRRLVVDHPLVDELVVMDDQSTDETAAVAAEAGATVVSTSDVLAHLAKGPGKGQAMWKSLHVTTGDLVVWCDADIRQFDTRFVTGVLGPMVLHPDVGFVKGWYQRPLGAADSGGGRVTELMARPVINLLHPHLAPIVQPLSGEYGGRRELLESVRFTAGYGVEIGLLIDLASRFGLERFAQVDLGERQHRNRQLDELGPQATAVLHAALRRAAPELVQRAATLVRPALEPVEVEVDELPPLASLAGDDHG